jgi:alanine-synthesizing transaminase
VDSLAPYGFGVTDEVKARVRASGADLIDLGLGNPDRPLSAPLVQRLHEAIDVPENHRYHLGTGLALARGAAAKWYARRYAADFDVEREVIVVLGAKEGISHLCLAVLGPEDVALVPDPCYPIHRGAPLIAGAAVEPYAVRRGLSPARALGDAIERVLHRGQRPKLVIANFPHNPTGIVLSKAELAEFVGEVMRAEALLLHDLAYADFAFGAPLAPSVFDIGIDASRVKQFAVEVISTSKSYNMPGARLGFMVGGARMIAALGHIKSYLDYGAFVPVQRAAAWALEHAEDVPRELCALYRTRAECLVQALGRAGFPELPKPEGTMFVWLELPPVWRALGSVGAACRLMERAQVATSPGAGFGPGGEGYLRLALVEDCPRLEEASARLGRLLSEDLGLARP